MMKNRVWLSCSILGLSILTISGQGCGNAMKTGVSSQGSSSNESTGDDSNQPVDEPVDQPAEEVTPSTLTHGKDLTLAMVGPAAIGITSFTTGSSQSLYDNSNVSYLKKINATATYDGYTINGPHFLIQGVALTGSIDVYTTLPMVIRGCKITAGGYWTIFTRSGAGATYILYSEVGGSLASPSNEVFMVGSDNVHIYRNHIMKMDGDGFSIGGKNVQIIENYVDQFIEAPGAHHDGIQAAGNNNGMKILRNKILLQTSETGAINLGTWGGGVATEVIVDSNYLAGGGYTFYGGSSDQNKVVVTNNIFGTDFFPQSGYYGALAYWQSGAGNVWTNNKLSNGNLITP